MRIDAAGSHFIGSYLCGLHELVAGGQGSDAVFLTERVGAVNDVLFHGIHIGIIGRDCGFWMRFRFIGFCLCRCFAGVGLVAFHLHTAVNAVPIDLKSHCLAHVPQLDVVVAVNDIGFHLHFFSIYDNAMVTALRHDPGGDRGRAAGQHCADEKTCKHGENLLLHKKSSCFLIYSLLRS